MTQTQDVGQNPEGSEGDGAPEVASTRADEFEREVGDLRATGGSAAIEARMLVVGMVCVAVGLVAIALGYWGASGTAVLNEQISYLISGGIFGIGVTIVGAGLYLRFTTQQFFRYWLIRLVYEQRAQTDRIVEALERDRNRNR